LLLLLYILLILDGVLDGPLEGDLFILVEQLMEVDLVQLGALLLHRLEDVAAEKHLVQRVQLRIVQVPIQLLIAIEVFILLVILVIRDQLNWVLLILVDLSLALDVIFLALLVLLLVLAVLDPDDNALLAKGDDGLHDDAHLLLDLRRKFVGVTLDDRGEPDDEALDLEFLLHGRLRQREDQPEEVLSAVQLIQSHQGVWGAVPQTHADALS
jgi:hypothetical protein